MKRKFKKVKKHTKKDRILFVGLVLLLLLVILFIILAKLINQPSKDVKLSNEMLEYINSDESWNEAEYPKNIAAFMDIYNGELEVKTVAKSTYYIATEVFPTYYTDLKDSSEEEIIEYYEKNQEAIYINLAIESKTQFVSLVKSLQSLSGESLNFESYRLDKDTIKAGANYTKATLYITYEENEELAINMTVKNKISSDCSSIIYKAYEE